MIFVFRDVTGSVSHHQCGPAGPGLRYVMSPAGSQSYGFLTHISLLVQVTNRIIYLGNFPKESHRTENPLET